MGVMTILLFFFFQAEDGIRDLTVTGVQTCALPISPQRVLVPQVPVLVAGFREVLWLSPDGEVEALAPPEARSRVERETPMLCHARATARRLDLPIFPALDLLELF